MNKKFGFCFWRFEVIKRFDFKQKFYIMNFDMVIEEGKKILAKKAHACGGRLWTILRTGADYKLQCDNCKRIILVDSNKFEKMVKKIEN